MNEEDKLGIAEVIVISVVTTIVVNVVWEAFMIILKSS